MVRTPSTMLPLGTEAPEFTLPNVDGENVSLADLKGSPALVVAFICNHCPFVKHIADELADFGNEYTDKGVAVVAISSNDVENYPDDSPEKMKAAAQEWGFRFAYLYDESQEVAKDYAAACTPDFYVFDGEQRLVYRGQFDASRPDSGIPVTGQDLRAAVDAVLADKPVPDEQHPSMGCNIKWKPGGEPSYFG